VLLAEHVGSVQLAVFLQQQVGQLHASFERRLLLVHA